MVESPLLSQTDVGADICLDKPLVPAIADANLPDEAEIMARKRLGRAEKREKKAAANAALAAADAENPTYHWAAEEVKSADGAWVWHRRLLMCRTPELTKLVIKFLHENNSRWSDASFFPECVLHQTLGDSTRYDLTKLDRILAKIISEVLARRKECEDAARDLLRESAGFFCADMVVYLIDQNQTLHCGWGGCNVREASLGLLSRCQYGSDPNLGNILQVTARSTRLCDRGVLKRDRELMVANLWSALERDSSALFFPSADLRSEVLARGARLCEFVGNISYLQCAGNMTVGVGREQRTVKCDKTRVVVDVTGFCLWNPGDTRFASTNTADSAIRMYSGLGDAERLLLPAAVPAFSMFAKEWGVIYVADLSPIFFRTQALDHLILQSEDKHILQSLVAGTFGHHAGIRDLVDEKGIGQVFLLHGPPGTGKTASAEAIAEYYRKPLYYVTAGELGVTPTELEKTLARILQTAVRWDAVILIDEADIFLLDRAESRDLNRNSMVCIFLKLLEYFDGVLFLTSNHIEQLDQAIASRLSCSIKFPPVDLLAVWKSLLAHFQVTSLGDDDIRRIIDAEPHANGRNVKRIIQNAILLAAYEKAQRAQALTVAADSAPIPSLAHFELAMRYIAFSHF